MSIKVFPLGAGQDVGGKRIMFDCGIHMIDKQKFPDFSYLAEENKTMDDVIDCVIITHFHLDHCGAIVQFSEMVGYNGPIIMTHPTRAIIPLMLEDLRRITIKQKGTEADFFTSDMIHRSMEKVTIIKLHETINIKDMKITAYYAGHVLGAAMFHVECGGQSVVYTGDFNMTADRHLGSAWIEKLKPDCLIMETTYATTIRDSKKSREREFLKKVEETLERNGKVLIPVFALGRAQELCILLETFCRRTNQKAPIYFSTGMTEKANFYYKLFVNWTNEKIKNSFIEESIFDFEHVKPFDKIYIKSKKPMVLFATPGMLHAGTSLNVFKEWASDPRNTVIIPGYCVPGTVGNKLLQGASKVEIDKKVVEVKCEIANLSFSAHADSKGLMQIIAHVEPKSVILVHGEKENMRIFAEKVESVFKIPCFYPPNYSMTHIASDLSIPLKISSVLVKETLHNHQIRLLMKEYLYNKKEVLLEDRLFSQLYNVRIENLELNGLLVIKNETELSLCSIKEAGEVSNGFLDSYDIEYFYQKAIPKGFENEDIITEFIKSMTKKLGIKEEAGGSTGTFFDIVFTREVDNIINIYWKEKDDALAQCVMDYFEDFCKNLLLELD